MTPNHALNRQRIMMISTHGYVDAEPELGLPDTGGQVVYVLELAKCLGRMGYAVDVLTRRLEGRCCCEHIDDSVRLLRFPCGNDDAFIAKEHLYREIPEWANRAYRFVLENGLDYAFINSHYWDAGLAGQALARRLKIPHLHTPHSIGAWKRDNMDGDASELEAKYNFRARIHAEQHIYNECDALIATTPIQREVLRGPTYGVPDRRIHVIPPGYDDTRFFPVSRASRQMLKTRYDCDGRIVLALGRLARNKGYDLLIQSMPYVFRRIADVRLLLAIGSTDLNADERVMLDELKSLARSLGIEDRIMFHDYIPDDALADYYRLADVFALSSRYEPFGMTAVEAMACGTPTVVTTEGGLWEQVTWGLEALYANPFDPEAFGHAICMVLEHGRVADQLAKFGSQKARARFTWTGIAQQVISLFDNWQQSVRDRRQTTPTTTHAFRMLEAKPSITPTPAAIDALLAVDDIAKTTIEIAATAESHTDVRIHGDDQAPAIRSAGSGGPAPANQHRRGWPTREEEQEVLRRESLSLALDTVNHPVLSD